MPSVKPRPEHIGPIRRFLYQWSSPGPPAMAIVALITGIGMLRNPQGYTSGSYWAAFNLMPIRNYGMLGVIIGCVGLASQAAWVQATIISAVYAWGGLLLYSAMAGHSPSPTGAAWPLAFAFASSIGIMRRGLGG